MTHALLSTGVTQATVYYVDQTEFREAFFNVEPVVLRALVYLLEQQPHAAALPIIEDLRHAIERRTP